MAYFLYFEFEQILFEQVIFECVPSRQIPMLHSMIDHNIIFTQNLRWVLRAIVDYTFMMV